MQTALDMNEHHVRGVSVDENDKTSAVSVGYLEEGLKAIDKVVYDFFVFFHDFRIDTYDLTEEGGQIYLSLKTGVALVRGNRFPFTRYAGKKGIELTEITNSLSFTFADPFPVDTQFVYVGELKNGVSFYFNITDPSLTLKIADPFLQAKYDGKTENQRLPNGFTDKKGIFMAKFTRVGVACNIIAPEGFNAHSFTFALKSFTPEYIVFYPPGGDSLLIEFFGLTKVGDNLLSLYRFLMEEKYRN